NRVGRLAQAALKGTVSDRQLKMAVTQTMTAFASAHRSARDPSALENCTDASVGVCITRSALTGLYPGGSHPPCYLVPQATRKGEQPELQWRCNHRGYAALAYEEAGLVLLPVAVYDGDEFTWAFGEIVNHSPSRQRGALVGVYVTIRQASSGVVLQRPWVDAEVIERSRARSSNREGKYSPWTTDYESMAMGAAIRWLHGRSAIPSSSAKLSEAMIEDAQVVQVHEEPRPAIAPPPSQRRAIPARAPAPESRQLPEPVEEETWDEASLEAEASEVEREQAGNGGGMWG
ncbi:MAG: recombinase RecT, partial [Gemmatimonadota bacterium]